MKRLNNIVINHCLLCTMCGNYKVIVERISRNGFMYLMIFIYVNVCEVEGTDTLLLTGMVLGAHLSIPINRKCVINVWIHFRLYTFEVKKYQNSNFRVLSIFPVLRLKVMQNQLCDVSLIFIFLYISWNSPNLY